MSTTETQIGVNTNLHKQDLSVLDVSNLTALSQEVISRQATINIGTIGHVAHGKSTVVKAISGVQTVRFKNELERNITIKLERISNDYMQALLNSPKLLREFEERQERKMRQRRMASQLQPQARCISIDTILAASSNNNSSNGSNIGLRHITPTITRCTSLSPSSGYESLYDNASQYSSTDSGRSTPKAHGSIKITGSQSLPSSKQVFKRRISEGKQKYNSRELATPSPTSNASKKRKRENLEYVVESIESLESINGRAVFFVKWLNYPANQNTWEAFENLIECVLLDPFIEQQYELFGKTIAGITSELEEEIERDQHAYDTSKMNVTELDSYEPLLLKVDLILLAQFRISGSKSQREPDKIRKRLLGMMVMKPFYYLRKQQLNDLKAWQNQMNSVELTAPVTVENNVDLDVLDKDFQYIKESFAGANVKISEDTPVGCKCEDGCAPLSKCCARMADSYFAYDKSGRLRIHPGEAIYECNKACACTDECVNRVIQRLRSNALCLFKTSSGCGWGLRTERSMRKGEFVCEYVGEIITSEEANERGKKYDAIGRTYLFDLDYNTTAESVFTIDAAVHGNISHFINHSCDPNLAVFPFWINNLDINMPRLSFFSLRAIKAGEELTFDYIRTDLSNDDYKNLSEAEKVTCRCGAANCRKVLF